MPKRKDSSVSKKSVKDVSFQKDIDKTKLLLESLLKKPKPTQKLLTRPPFRFIFDIIINLNRNFRKLDPEKTIKFFDSKLNDKQLISENIKSKDEKINFLEQVKELVEEVLDSTVDIRFSKLVAGQECKATNIFLQKIVLTFQKCKEEMTNVSEGKQEETSIVKEETSVVSKKKVNKVEVSDEVDSVVDIKSKLTNEKSKIATIKPDEMLKQADGKINTTMNLYKNLLKKPKMTEKLLTRPPFRFIHDIIAELNRKTSFFKNFLTTNQLVSKNVKSKEEKIAFLMGLMKFLNQSLNIKMSSVVNVKKIIAGQECERTNRFLQLLALVVPKEALVEESALDDEEDIVIPASKALTKVESEVEKSTKQPMMEAKVNEPKRQLKEEKANDVEKQKKTHQDETETQEESTSVDLQRPQTARKKPPKKKSVDELKPQKVEAEKKVESKSKEFIEHKVDSAETLEGETNITKDEETEDFYRSLDEHVPTEEQDTEQKHSPVADELVESSYSAKLMKLQEGVKAICRNMTPLMSFIDCYQSDCESMKNELSQWIEKKAKRELKLTEAKELTKKELEPQKEKLKLLEVEIKEVKAKLLQKERKLVENEKRYKEIVNELCFSY